MKRKPRKPPPLTREILMEALEAAQAMRGDPITEYMLDTWHEIFGDYDIEILALAIAAIDRLTPRSRGYRPRKDLGPTQSRIVDFVRAHPQCSVTEIAKELGVNYGNMRRMMPVLVKRGLIRREYKPGGASMVWSVAATTAADKS